MNDRISLAEKLRAAIGVFGHFSRRTLLCRLGVAATLAAAASLATAVPAPAQSQQQTPGTQPQPPKAAAPAPRRRGITGPESSAPSPSGDKSKGDDDDSIPGGLPGAGPKSPSGPGGGRSNPGG